MYLSKLIVINYRSCQKLLIDFDCNYPNILIGINDCGKSSLLQSIGLLLNPKAKFNFSSEDKKKDDMSNTRLEKKGFESLMNEVGLPMLTYSGRETIVVGKFVLEGSDRKKDDLSNHLRWVRSSNNDNSLWLAKVFDETTKKATIYLLTNDSDEILGCYKEKDTALNKRKKDLNLTSDEINNTNMAGRFSNIELIAAIYNRYKTTPRWAEYELDKEKGFWIEYRYLDWNIALEQLTQFANDAINQKISGQIELANKFAREQAGIAQQIVNDELSKLTVSLRADLQNIKSIEANVNFQINSLITDLFVDKINSDGAVHLDSQGDGVKRQLWFALIKWNALNSIQDDNKDTKFIWCFDEPETHLYPKAQREFFEIIKGVSTTNVQSVISTHSTVFIDRAKLTSINKVDLSNGYTLFSKCNAIDDIYRSLQIKNSDFLFFDKFLAVEGDTEFALIPFLYELKFGRPLAADSIQLINLGGKSKRRENQKILGYILEGFRKDTSSSIVYIFDNDIRSDITSHEMSQMKCFCIGKQDIEDSIDNSVWVEIINVESSGKITLSESEVQNIKNCIPEATPQSVINANQKFYGRLKSLLDRKILEDDLHDLHGFIPAKGIESGKLLSRYIKQVEQIDSKIFDAFDRLHN